MRRCGHWTTTRALRASDLQPVLVGTPRQHSRRAALRYSRQGIVMYGVPTFWIYVRGTFVHLKCFDATSVRFCQKCSAPVGTYRCGAYLRDALESLLRRSEQAVWCTKCGQKYPFTLPTVSLRRRLELRPVLRLRAERDGGGRRRSSANGELPAQEASAAVGDLRNRPEPITHAPRHSASATEQVGLFRVTADAMAHRPLQEDLARSATQLPRDQNHEMAPKTSRGRRERGRNATPRAGLDGNSVAHQPHLQDRGPALWA
jgi:hypothetical protein